MATTGTFFPRRDENGTAVAATLLRYDVAETAQFVRAALRKAFGKAYPSTKFTVRSSRYSGGSSIDVAWTDGPTTAEVDAIVGEYASAKGDGVYRKIAQPDGSYIMYGADYVMTERAYSKRFLEDTARTVAQMYNVPVCPITEYQPGDCRPEWQGAEPEPKIDGEWLYEVVFNLAKHASRPANA